MKRLILIVILAISFTGCVQTLYAQGLPATLTVNWDPNSVVDNVSSYEIWLDNSPADVISAVPNGANKIQTTIVVPTYGHHIISVVAKSVSLMCDNPEQCDGISVQTSGPSLLGFNLAPQPGSPKAIKVRK